MWLAGIFRDHHQTKHDKKKYLKLALDLTLLYIIDYETDATDYIMTKNKGMYIHSCSNNLSRT